MTRFLLVLGAETALGRLLTWSAAADGMTVAIWDQDLARADELAEAIRAQGGSIRVETGDATDALSDCLGSFEAVADLRFDVREDDATVQEVAERAVGRLPRGGCYLRVSSGENVGLSSASRTQIALTSRRRGVTFGVIEVDLDLTGGRDPSKLARMFSLALQDDVAVNLAIRLS